MVKTERAEQRPRFECEPLPGGATLIRLYEDEQEVTREAVSNMDTPRNGWQYTTYEMITALPAGGLSAAPDAWATLVKQYDYDAAAVAVRTERDKLIDATDWTVLGDAKTDKEDWKAYRQALRDVPEQEGFPYDVVWPEPPRNAKP